MEKLEWSGQKAYNDAKFVDWKVDGKAAGYTKAAGHLSVSLRRAVEDDANGSDGQDLRCWYVYTYS
jgi:hypothetical protein